LIVFIRKLSLFILFNVAVFCLLVYIFNSPIKSFPLRNWETESNLFVIEEGQHYDCVILGASTGRVLSRNGNHITTESLLEKKILNLAQGKGSGGLEKNLLYFSYFLNKSNKTKEVLYFLPPQSLYTDFYDNLNMKAEPFRWEFFLHMINMKIDVGTIFNYIQSKISFNWFETANIKSNKRVLTSIDTSAIRKNLAIWNSYEISYPAEPYEKLEHLDHIIELSKKNNIVLNIVIMPSLLSSIYRHEETMKYLKEFVRYDNVQLWDFSKSIKDPKFYYDHVHLNSAGARKFCSLELYKVFED